MYNTLYQKPDIELPYNIDNRYSKSIQEGITKEKWECRWVVLTEEVNEFITNLEKSYNELALVDVTRDDRGPLTVLTANYGDSGLTNGYDGDGEISWWTFGGSVYSYHIRRWVTNTPTDIKDFCTSCVTTYGYTKEEVTVTCNPVAGEPRVMCEATFTPNIENLDEEGNYSGGDFNDDEADEEGLIEQGNSIQFTSSTDSMAVPVISYVSLKLGCNLWDAEHLVKLVGRVDSGELVYREAGTYGATMPPTSGWYYADDNPQALRKPAISEQGNITADNVAKTRAAMQNVPEASFTSIKVTTTSTISSRQKITNQTLQNKLNQTGEEQKGEVGWGSGQTGGQNPENDIPGTNGNMGITNNPSLNAGGAKIQIPKSCWVATDPEGHTYPLVCGWLNEGTSFDATTVKSNYTTDRRVYYTGTLSQTYRTTATFAKIGEGGCNNGSGQPINL